MHARVHAETGSGETLAFGLPILHRILTQRDEETNESASDSDSESIEKGRGGDGDANGGYTCRSAVLFVLPAVGR